MNHKSAFTETWRLNKPAVSTGDGIVVSQHYEASAVGAQVLSEGGNAVDAAIATSLALAAVEPWMSGLGGCGNLLYYQADSDHCDAVSFGVRAPLGLNKDDYPLAGGQASDLFAWPAVVEDRNVHGPKSVAVPGYVAGIAHALERFGTRPFASVVAPAIELAHRGMDVDWYASLKIGSCAQLLSRFEPSASIYLDEGHTPVGEWGGPLPRIELAGLAQTLETLAQNGAMDFYHGELAEQIIDDAKAVGIGLSAEDLNQYRVTETEACNYSYAKSSVLTVPGMTAGPTLNHALDLLEKSATTAGGHQPDESRYGAIARSLDEAYQYRLKHLGDADDSASPSCTTHLSVTDRDGNVVSLTQTLLSLFGSKVVLPETGILMNNGIMWFDPRPGQINSMAAGRWPLSNMCPVILKTDDKTVALGASGGRRIMPAVFQLVSFLVDHNMSLEKAAHYPRIDVSGSPVFSVDDRLPAALLEDIEDRTVVRAPNGVYPALFACPNIAAFHKARAISEGAAYVASPWAMAASGTVEPSLS